MFSAKGEGLRASCRPTKGVPHTVTAHATYKKPVALALLDSSSSLITTMASSASSSTAQMPNPLEQTAINMLQHRILETRHTMPKERDSPAWEAWGNNIVSLVVRTVLYVPRTNR